MSTFIHLMRGQMSLHAILDRGQMSEGEHVRPPHISVHIEHIEILIFTSFKIQESIIKSIKQSDRPW